MKTDNLTSAQRETVNSTGIPDESIEDCPKCSGSGELQPDVECKACLGTGIKHFETMNLPEETPEKITISCSRSKAEEMKSDLIFLQDYYDLTHKMVFNSASKSIGEIITALDECINAPLPFRRMTEEEMNNDD